jgi:diguanylate cyclase (GGDEF)-like protein/PAS domain S-box-containing protein
MELWQPLLANLAIASVALVAWISLPTRLPKNTSALLFGIAMAIATLGSMVTSHKMEHGIYVDFRSTLIGLAALFGGLPAALLTTGIALIYRLYLGGAVWVGSVSILLSALIGLLMFAWCKGKQIRHGTLVLLSAAIALKGYLVSFAVPMEMRSALLGNLSETVVATFAGTLLLGVVLLQDRRRRELAVLNDQYRFMVDALPDCLNFKDAEGRFVVANPATARLMNARTPDDLIGKTDFDFYPPALADTYRKDEEEVMQRGQSTLIEQRRSHPDGSINWLSTMKVPIKDTSSGNVAAIITHNRDITLQKETQDKLIEIQSYLDQALEHMSDGLVLFDQNGTILFCNRQYQKLFPLTGHLRVPEARFSDIVEASVGSGEEPLPPGVDLQAHVSKKLGELRNDNEALIELYDGRIYRSQTKLLGNGCSLRVISDETERLSFERDLTHQAFHDKLTGLPNRAMFDREFKRLLEGARADKNELVVMLIDLDRLKEVNDRFGHDMGDKLLVAAARRIEATVRRGDIAARLGGDEFAVLMTGPIESTNGPGLADRLTRNLAKPLALDGVTLIPSGTIGFTTFPVDQSDCEGLLRNADRALYKAKARRRGTWGQFDGVNSLVSAQGRTA